MEKSTSCTLYSCLADTHIFTQTYGHVHTLAHATHAHAPLSDGKGLVEVPPIDRPSLAPPRVHPDNALCNIPLLFLHTCLQLRLIKGGPQTQATYVCTSPVLHWSQQHWHSTKFRPKPEGPSTPPSSPPHPPPTLTLTFTTTPAARPSPSLQHLLPTPLPHYNIPLPPLSLTTTSPSHPSPSLPQHLPPTPPPHQPQLLHQESCGSCLSLCLCQPLQAYLSEGCGGRLQVVHPETSKCVHRLFVVNQS